MIQLYQKINILKVLAKLMDDPYKGFYLREIRRTLIGMERKGWVKIDRLPDRMFVRLLRTDFLFLGRDETQRKAVKHKKGKRDNVTREKLMHDPYDDIMYA